MTKIEEIRQTVIDYRTKQQEQSKKEAERAISVFKKLGERQWTK